MGRFFLWFTEWQQCLIQKLSSKFQNNGGRSLYWKKLSGQNYSTSENNKSGCTDGIPTFKSSEISLQQWISKYLLKIWNKKRCLKIWIKTSLHKALASIMTKWYCWTIHITSSWTLGKYMTIQRKMSYSILASQRSSLDYITVQNT